MFTYTRNTEESYIVPELDPMKAITFANSRDLSEWLENNHSIESELWIKIFKKNTGVQE